VTVAPGLLFLFIFGLKFHTMKRTFLAAVLLCPLPVLLAQLPGDYPYRPVSFADVHINDHFWLPRIETNRNVTIPFAFSKCEATGRLQNFKVAGEVNEGKIASGKFCSLYGYDDSDVYKIIEGAAYSLTTYPDPKLEAFLDSLIADIASAQEPDGYLYTMRTINPGRSWAKERWVNDRYNGSHELYNVGHMYEAAVAYYYATGKKSLLEVAIKNADLLCKTFGPGKKEIASGHQEIEIGLAKLYRVTGDKKYLGLAKFLLDERGKGEKAGSTYTQDHQPVADQQEAVGHAVRATYMYSAMADIAALMGDTAYLRAIDRIWDNVVTKKIYVTGGIGSRSNGEAYGDNYELPNLTAYNETCAAIANIFWNYRMFLLHGDSKYIDVLEKTLYNGMISGVSLGGATFFYPNPLASEGKYERSEWFDCSCCPSNVTRFISSVSGYIYASRGDSLFVNLFIGNSGKMKVGEQQVAVSQMTDYPWDGQVKIAVSPALPARMTLCVRIPGWARNEAIPGGLYSFTDTLAVGASVSVNGKLFPPRMHNGYALISRMWKAGDTITLDLPMSVRRVAASPMVGEDRDRISLERGPVMFCAEGIDNGGDVAGVVIPEGTALKYSFEPELLKGVGVIDGDVLKLKGDGFVQPVRKIREPFRAIPYYAWCHRGAGTMNVWFYGPGYVFTPDMQPAGSLFLDSIKVSMKQYEDQSVRYTLFNSTPSPSSRSYTQPLTLNETTTVQAFAYNLAGKQSELSKGIFTKTTPTPSLMVSNVEPGVTYLYYEGRYRKMPDWSKEKVLKSGVVADFDIISARDTADAYGMVFEGFVNIPADAVYTFYSVSDDGSRLLIDDREVLLNDGLHEMAEASGQVALKSGLHRIRIEYYDYGAAEGLEVYIRQEGGDRMVLPAKWLYHTP
jgi:DUF1680 family protein